MLHAVAAPVAVPRVSVPRPRLVDGLLAAQQPLVVIAAPAGYGKTTLVDEWERRDPRPFARLTLTRRDDDPGVLTRRVERALDAVRAAPAFVLVIDDLDAV